MAVSKIKRAQTNKKKQKITKTEHNETIEYVSIIDKSSINNESVQIILNEIGADLSDVISSDACIDTMKCIVDQCKATELLELFCKINLECIYKFAGAKNIENILAKMNEINQTNCTDSFCNTVLEKFNQIDINNLINDENSSHAFRKLLTLLTGKIIYKNDVVSGFHPDNKFILQFKKSVLLHYVFRENSKDTVWIGLMHFIQATKSQKFIKKSIDFMIENVKERRKKNGTELISNFMRNKAFFYEKVAELANDSNSALLVDFIKNDLRSLQIKQNYLVQKILRHSRTNLIEYLDIDEDWGNNVFIAAMINLLNTGKSNMVEQFIGRKEGVAKAGVFYTFILERYNNEVDTKYVDLVCKMLQNGNDGLENTGSNKIAGDFVKYFNKKIINSKAGKKLLMAFAESKCDQEIVSGFFDQNIELFYGIEKWDNLHKFMHRVAAVTSGKTRNKACEILRKSKP
ncbi:hypothetical protein ECANGB1_867 [Enterospora canceri]|uniref:Uncharacterized protein n=1 Tax=Enterospora canceri TaxID=1081671 RepID=A0A1Y1S7D8_9MICR|nr:hypothetical protein ECANGB1_867 [Enterospora canceri]